MVSIAEIATIREALPNGSGTAHDAREVFDRLHARHVTTPQEFSPKKHDGVAGFSWDGDLGPFVKSVLGNATTARIIQKTTRFLSEQGAVLNTGRPGRGKQWWLAAEWPAGDAEPVTAIEPAAEGEAVAPAPFSVIFSQPDAAPEPDSANVRIVVEPEPVEPVPAAEPAAPEDPTAALATLGAYVRGAAARHADLQARITALEAELAAAQARNRQLEEWGQRGLDLLTGDPQD